MRTFRIPIWWLYNFILNVSLQWLKFYSQNNLEEIVGTSMYSPVMHKWPFCILNFIHFRDLYKIKLYWPQIHILYILPVSEPLYMTLCKYYSMCNPIYKPKIMIISEFQAEGLFSVPENLIQHTYISNLQAHIMPQWDPMACCPLIPA